MLAWTSRASTYALAIVAGSAVILLLAVLRVVEIIASIATGIFVIGLIVFGLAAWGIGAPAYWEAFAKSGEMAALFLIIAAACRAFPLLLLRK